MSFPPLGATGTIRRTGRDGCATASEVSRCCRNGSSRGASSAKASRTSQRVLLGAMPVGCHAVAPGCGLHIEIVEIGVSYPASTTSWQTRN
jgi:hypothetical protein